MGWFGGSNNDNNSSSSASQSPTPDFNPPTAPLSSPSEFSSSSGSSSLQSSTAIRQRLESEIAQQSNLANARFLMTKVNENCFAHCVPSPGSSLSAREDQCLSACMEKYIEAWNTVSRTYVSRLQTEGKALPTGGQGLSKGL